MLVCGENVKVMVKSCYVTRVSVFSTNVNVFVALNGNSKNVSLINALLIIIEVASNLYLPYLFFSLRGLFPLFSICNNRDFFLSFF